MLCQLSWYYDTKLQGLRSQHKQPWKNKSNGRETRFEMYRTITSLSKIHPTMRQVKLTEESVLIGAKNIHVSTYQEQSQQHSTENLNNHHTFSWS